MGQILQNAKLITSVWRSVSEAPHVFNLDSGEWPASLHLMYQWGSNKYYPLYGSLRKPMSWFGLHTCRGKGLSM